MDLTPEKIKYEDKKISKVFLDDYKTLVCDLDLPSEILGMYEVGQYLYHPNYLFASTHEKLCKTNCRFKIYSSGLWSAFSERFPFHPSHLFVSDKNKKCTTNCRFKIYTLGLLSDFQDKYPYVEEDRDILVSDVAGIFKVVDICKKKKVTQITLVNIPIETENFMREHKALFEDYFLRKARKDFYKSFKVGKAIDARDLEYSSLALGIFKHKGEYKFFTKSDICSFLLIVSNLYELHGIEFLDDLLLKYDVDNLISQYLIFEGNNDYDDSSYQSVHGLKCNVIAPIEFGNMLFEAYLELNENRLELVEDNMDKYLLNYDGETPLVNTEISNLLYNS